MARELMFTLIGICCILMIFSFITNSISKRRKNAMFSMALIAMLLVIGDRFARTFNGYAGLKYFWIVRVSKFSVYFLFLAIVFAFNRYLVDLFLDDEKLQRKLKYVEVILFIGTILLIISQFTGLYYTYTENNVYQRSRGNGISYIFPLITLIMQAVLILKDQKLRKRMKFPLLLFIIMPIIASVFQFVFHGVSLTSTCIVAMVVLLYVISIVDTNNLLKVAYQRETTMVSQTTAALAEAIDAKDKYTNGHSRRVAEYSAMIAKAAGKDEEECREIYLAALLHDVGKIGVPGSIISKEGKLTDEEFEKIKMHPVIGESILSKIEISPSLSIGAHYHHERYDGKGYPEGLKGEEIPEIARIIAVADAYDAMTSKRSYRDSLSQEVVRGQIEKGTGTQFDPKFAKIMLKFIDEDKEYNMRQKIDH